MSRRRIPSFVTGLFLIALSLVAAAQNDMQRRMQASIPYSFQAANETLPAGAYTFVVNTAQHRIQVINDSTRRSVFVLGRPENADTGGAGNADGGPADRYTQRTGNERYYVVLDKAGDTYRLYQVQGHGFGVVTGAQQGTLVTIEGSGTSSGVEQ